MQLSNGQAIEQTNEEARAQDVADHREALAEEPAPRSIGEHLRREEVRSRTLTEAEIRERARRRGGLAGDMRRHFEVRAQAEGTVAARLAPPEPEEPDTQVRSWRLEIEPGRDAYTPPSFALRVRAPALDREVQARKTQHHRAWQEALKAARAEARQGPAHQRYADAQRVVVETRLALDEARRAGPEGWERARQAIAEGKDPARFEKAALRANEQVQVLENRLAVLERLRDEAEGAAGDELDLAERNFRQRWQAEREAQQAQAREQVGRLIEQLLQVAIESGLEIATTQAFSTYR